MEFIEDTKTSYFICLTMEHSENVKREAWNSSMYNEKMIWDC